MRKILKQSFSLSVNEALPDCIACRKCREIGRCIFNDIVNEFVEKAKSADGFVFGSPVYYAHPSGRLLTFMDRAFYSGASAFCFKPAAAVLSARRAGTTASIGVTTSILQSTPCLSFRQPIGIRFTVRSRNRF